VQQNRALIQQIVFAFAILLVGAAFGHWLTKSDRTETPTASSTATAVHAAATPASLMMPAASESSAVDASKTDDSASHVTEKKSLAQILKEKNIGSRTRLLEEFARGIAPADIGSALKDLRKTPEGSARELAQRLLVSRWVETDPEGALAFASQNRDFSSIAGDVMQQMASEDFQGALARAQSIQDVSARYEALRGVLNYLTDSDPLGALKLAATLGDFPGYEPLSQTIYRQWSQIDPQAAAAAAAQAAGGNAGSGADWWRSPVNQVLRNWASQDPMAAINWSSSLNDPNMQARDISQIVRQWSRDDPNAAASWVNSQQAGPTRDAAASALAFSLGSSDPAAALGWAQSISDPGQRDSALSRLTRQIMYQNPGNGAAILQAAGIPQSMIPVPGQGGGGRGRRGGP
jgi:hypothetical protein